MEAYIVKVPFITELFEQDRAYGAIKENYNHEGFPDQRFEALRVVAALDKPYAITKDPKVSTSNFRLRISWLSWIGKDSKEDGFMGPVSEMVDYVEVVEIQNIDQKTLKLEEYLKTLHQKGE